MPKGQSDRRSPMQLLFRTWSPGAFAVALILFYGSQLSAQVATADIVGTVTDNSGSIVPGAKITATNVETNLGYSAESNADGNFVLTQLPAGHYRFDAEKTGFKSWRIADIRLAIGDRYRADVRMEVGRLDQTITVLAEEAHLQTESATVASLIDERQVQDLPLLGRNFVTLTQLVPGATDYDTGSFSTGNAVDDRRRPSSVSVNGFLATQNNFMIDGMDNNERFIATVTVKPSIEAIGEIKVITNTFSAELSRANGAGISFITEGRDQYPARVAVRVLPQPDAWTRARRYSLTPRPRLRTGRTISAAASAARSRRTRRSSFTTGRPTW